MVGTCQEDHAACLAICSSPTCGNPDWEEVPPTSGTHKAGLAAQRTLTCCSHKPLTLRGSQGKESCTQETAG